MNTKLKLVGETEVQNYKVPSHIWKEVTDLKNIHIFAFRMSSNLSQQKASEIAGVPVGTWTNLENKRMIPTDREAEKVCQLLNKPVYAVFHQTRHEVTHRVVFRSLSKLALYRAVKGIAQVDLARRSCVPLKVIRMLENEWQSGEDIPLDYFNQIADLAVYLGLDIVDIIGTAEEVKKNA